VWARAEARRVGDRRVGTDHLVLGLLHDPAIAGILDVTIERARDALAAIDRDALAAVGMVASFDAPPLAMQQVPARPTLRVVLQDRIPLTPAAKRALQQAAKPMRRGRHVTPQSVLVQLLDFEQPDPAAVLFQALELDAAAVRARLEP
jgi:hypothetical protein